VALHSIEPHEKMTVAIKTQNAATFEMNTIKKLTPSADLFLMKR